MGQVVFLNCFHKSEVSGGIKTTYRHAAMLSDMGVNVKVLQPEGLPPWLGDQSLERFVCSEISLEEGDVAVFPEILQGWFAEAIREPWPCTKVIFCQNPYYFITYCPSKESLIEWNIDRIIVPSEWTKRILQSILGFDNIDVISPAVNTERFVPKTKELRVLVAGWKWKPQGNLPGYDVLIQKAFHSKYPSLKPVPWTRLEDIPEDNVADLMGRSVVCLALGRLESLGITALEAMAARCFVVGFHGGGGMDYATSQNGFWHSPEDIEGVVDSLALTLELGQRPTIIGQAMLDQGQRTAFRYDIHNTQTRLRNVYSVLLKSAI